MNGIVKPLTIEEVLAERVRKEAEASLIRSKFHPFARDIMSLLNSGARWPDVLAFLRGRLVVPETGEVEVITDKRHRSQILSFVRIHAARLDAEMGTTEVEKASRVVDVSPRRKAGKGTSAPVTRAGVPLMATVAPERPVAPSRSPFEVPPAVEAPARAPAPFSRPPLEPLVPEPESARVSRKLPPIFGTPPPAVPDGVRHGLRPTVVMSKEEIEKRVSEMRNAQRPGIGGTRYKKDGEKDLGS